MKNHNHHKQNHLQNKSSKEVWKLIFRQYGQMETHSQEETRRREKSRQGEDADARKGRKVGNHSVFPMFCGSGGSKSRLAKAAGAEPAGQIKDEKMHAIVARSTFGCKSVKIRRVRTTFGREDVEKVHAVVSRSTIRSKQ